MKLRYKYWTKIPGIGGSIKTPEDFIVKELISPKFMKRYGRTKRGIRAIDSKYSLYLLKKRDLTTHEAIRRLSKTLKIDENAIGYAGLKDRFAVTQQYITIKDKHKPVREKGLELTFIKKTDKYISPGDLIRNEFTITLHDCKNIKNLGKVIEELKKQGMPNYFGLQRFGSNKNNHIIGKHLVRKEFSHALKVINQNYKKKYKKITTVPKRLLKFFINSYQSWIFNETLNKYIGKSKKPCLGSVKLVAFRLPELRIFCTGGSRKLFISVSDINFSRLNNSVKISFSLPKGSYATILLREISKW